MSARLALTFSLVAFAIAPALATDVATVAPGAFPTSADAQDPIAGLYGEVVSVHNEQTGRDSTFAFHANHTFLIIANWNNREVLISGLWGPSTDNTKICFQPSPLGGVTVPEMQSCLPLAGHTNGDRWSALNDANQTLDLAVGPASWNMALPPG